LSSHHLDTEIESSEEPERVSPKALERPKKRLEVPCAVLKGSDDQESEYSICLKKKRKGKNEGGPIRTNRKSTRRQ
jgi:hypothetical protein